MFYPPSWQGFGGTAPPQPQQHLPWVAEVTRTAVTQRLQSTAARRAMVAAGARSGLSVACAGGLAPHHQVGTTAWPTSLGRTGRVRWGQRPTPSGPSRRGVWAGPLSSCWRLRASILQPQEGLGDVTPSSQPYLTEVAPLGQRLTPSKASGLHCTLHSHPNRWTHPSGHLGPPEA